MIRSIQADEVLIKQIFHRDLSVIKCLMKSALKLVYKKYLNEMFHHREINKNIAGIINGYDNTLYNKQEKEDIYDLSIPILQKKLKQMK